MTNTPGDDQQPQQPPSPAGAPPYPPPGYQQPGHQGYAPAGWYGGPPLVRLPDHPKATTALVLGIIALLGGFTCYLPLFLGPWAWAFGRRAVREIDAQPGRYDGRGQALAGYILGVVATVLLLLGLVALIAFLGFVFFAEPTNGPTPLESEPF
ncbi:MAG: DUF4190 domain-containing protein [Nocardioides sp.]